MKEMKIRVKKLHKDAVIPKYSKIGDAGMDLTAVNHKVTPEYVEYYTGLAFEIPVGYVGLVFPRSSVSNKDLIMANSVGVIDSGYRGEVTARFRQVEENIYKDGDRIAQMIVMPVPFVVFTEVDELSSSDRGIGSYGSTGD